MAVLDRAAAPSLALAAARAKSPLSVIVPLCETCRLTLHLLLAPVHMQTCTYAGRYVVGAAGTGFESVVNALQAAGANGSRLQRVEAESLP